MYYYMKTDIGPSDYPWSPNRKGHFFGLQEADSPEEAEAKFKRLLAGCLSSSGVRSNRQEAARRLSRKDHMVEEYIPVPDKDVDWKVRVASSTRYDY